MTGPRYAIYFAPEDDTELARFGWSWLGRTPHSIADAPFPPSVASHPGHTAIIAEARLYGFHATLKPPFHLADGERVDDLVNLLHDFCATQKCFETHPLRLDEIGGFLALRPAGPAHGLDALAAVCVRYFDRFRAQSTAEDIAKRAARGLTSRQSELLQSWGYPYVLDEFRFHMTLTCRLEDPERASVRACLTSLLSTATKEHLRVRSLCLFEQMNPAARFTLKQRLQFAD